MNDHHAKGFVPIVCLVLTICGCAHRAPAPIEDRTQHTTIEPDRVIPFPSSEDAVAGDKLPIVPAMSDRTAKIAIDPALAATEQLLAAADEAIAAGQYGAAAASVERAIRLTPEDPWAWYRLAKLRFLEGDYDQAKATAQRSNALPGATPRLRAANWFLIADVERINGDESAADEAYGRAQIQSSTRAIEQDGDQGTGGNLPFSE